MVSRFSAGELSPAPAVGGFISFRLYVMWEIISPVYSFEKHFYWNQTCTQIHKHLAIDLMLVFPRYFMFLLAVEYTRVIIIIFFTIKSRAKFSDIKDKVSLVNQFQFLLPLQIYTFVSVVSVHFLTICFFFGLCYTIRLWTTYFSASYHYQVHVELALIMV